MTAKTSSLLYETMTRVETKNFVCRVWSYHLDDEEIRQTAEHEMLRSTRVDVRQVITTLVQIDGVNSVELIDRRTDCGMCVHKDWP